MNNAAGVMNNAEGNGVAKTSVTSNAGAMRAYRKRRKRGIRIVRVHVTDGELDVVAARGYEGAGQRTNRTVLDSAVSQFLSDVLFG